MAELCVWVKDKTGLYVQRYVDKEDWKTAIDRRREEEKATKAKNQGQAQPFFGASSIEVKVRDEETGTYTPIPLAECVRANPREQDGVGDMTSLTFLDEPTMLHNMRFRFAKDMIYTSISRVLCAANPYRMLDIYKEEEMKRYRGAERVEALPPHIFGTAERAYQALKRGVNQSMICCGESGSGKTESTKLLMRYLATAKQGKEEKKGADDARVQDRVLEANPILESFGNASTLMNNNSSRFAKFTKLYFSSEWDLVSADIVTYLLEKSRVCRPPTGERNYHSFYSLFYIPQNIKDTIKVDLKMDGKKPHDFNYLKNSPLDRIDDAEFARDMLNGMITLGFSPELRDSILQTLSGILHLGNILPFTSESKEIPSEVDTTAALFGVTKKAFVHCLTTREITTKGETINKPRTTEEFIANRDTMGKALYVAMFDVIVANINLAFRGGKFKEGKWIGVLDVFGFEHFEHNSFEQLCINFCNEKLQQFFNSYIISSEQEEYEKEGIFWTTLDTRDRSGCLRLFEAKSPPGIYPLLDSANAQSSTFKAFLGTLNQQHKYNRFLFKPRPVAGRYQTEEEKRKQDLLEVSFGVRHYAANVVYDTTDLLVKNADRIDPATINLYNSSTNVLVKDLLAKEDPSARKESVGTFFVNQLQALTDTLSKTSPHFIRCINPNNLKKKQHFDTRYVSPQLVNGGLVEAVRMLKLGYPTRYPYTLFFNTFKPLLNIVEKGEEKDEGDGTLARFFASKAILHKSKNNTPRYINIRDFCEGAMVAFGLQRDQYQCGLTKMFFRSGLQELVEETLQKGQQPDKLQPKVIHRMEKWLTYKRILRLTGSTKFLGRLWLFQKRTNAARQLQVAVRTMLFWESRVHWKDRREKAATTLRNFWLWCRHDRIYLCVRRVVQKMIDQLREAKEAQNARLKQEKNRTPAHVLSDFADWISGLTGVPVISSLFPSLTTGELLCNLLMKIKTDLVIDGVHQNKKQLFFARDNVSKAVKGLMVMRCPSNHLFAPDDLLSTVQPNHKKVIYCFTWLARHAYTKYEIPLPKYMQSKLDAGGDLDDDDEDTQQQGDVTTRAASGSVSAGKKGRAFGDLSDDEEEGVTVSGGSSESGESGGGSGGGSGEGGTKSALSKGGKDPTKKRVTIAPSADGAGIGKYGTMKGLSVQRQSKLSQAPDQKDVLSDLKAGYDKYFKFIIEGGLFRHYTLEKVVLRWLRIAPPRGVSEKDLTFEALLAQPNLRLILTKSDDQSSLSSLINFSDVQYIFSGKRDGGKCFPLESKAADSSVAVDERCLVVGTKNRVLGLEAESQGRRDVWVEALEWALALRLYGNQKSSAPEEEKVELVMDPLLLKGGWFIKHGLQGITKRFIKCTPSHIYWLKGDDSPLSECIDPIAWDTVSDILRGKQTLMFSRSRAKDVDDALCVSIVYRADHRSLDLVATTEEQAFEFYSAMSGYLQELIESYSKSKNKIAMEAELEHLKSAIAKEKEAHIHTVGQLSEQKAKTADQLEQLRATRAALDTYSSPESEMERLNKMMQEEKSQLVQRIEDLHGKIKELTGQLDTELQRNASLLSELQEARQTKLELVALRAEVAEQRSQRAAMAKELSQLLTLWNGKFAALSTAIGSSDS